MKRLQFTFSICAITAAIGVHAQSLFELYDKARDFDATYKSAQAQFEADTASAKASIAGILPQVGLSGDQAHSTYNNSAAGGTGQRIFKTNTTNLYASQALYDPAAWANFQQGEQSKVRAQLVLLQAEQDLMLRVGRAYFDVLIAQANLKTIEAQKNAVAEQLKAAQRSFEVGTVTITDAKEAQASFDLVLAQEIQAVNDLDLKTLSLEQLVGQTDLSLKAIQPITTMPAFLDQPLATWVQQSRLQDPAVKVAERDLELAKLDVDKAYAAHKPTVTLNAARTLTHNFGDEISNTNYREQLSTIGVSFNLPLFAGFSGVQGVHAAVAREDKAQSDLTAALRKAELDTKDAYLNVQMNLSSVKAYETALVSSQSSLEANQLGFQVGVRITTDVLNAQKQLYQTRQSLDAARYETLFQFLKLKQAQGTLDAEALKTVSDLMTVSQSNLKYP